MKISKALSFVGTLALAFNYVSTLAAYATPAPNIEIAVDSPSNGATVPHEFTISGTATSTEGISEVELEFHVIPSSINKKFTYVITVDSAVSPVNWSLDINNGVNEVPDGRYQIQVQATSLEGHKSNTVSLTNIIIGEGGSITVSTPVIFYPVNGVVHTTADQDKVDWTTPPECGGFELCQYQYQAFSDSDYTINRWGPSTWLTNSEILTPGTPEGVYYIRVRAREWETPGTETDWSNGAGNVYKITVDNTAPFVEVTSHDNGDTLSGTVDVRGTVTDANPHHYWAVVHDSDGHQVAGPGVVNRTDSFTDESLFLWDTTAVEDGAYTIKLEARDAAGNKDPSTSVDWVNVAVDNPPSKPTGLTIYKDIDPGTGKNWVEVGCGGYTDTQDIKIVWNQNPEEDMNHYVFGTRFNDHHQTIPYPKNWKIGHMSAGFDYYYYTVIAVDNAGQESEISDKCYLYLDQEAPYTILKSPDDGSYWNTPILIAGISEDDNTGVDYVNLYYSTEADPTNWIFITDVDNPANDSPFDWDYLWTPPAEGTYNIWASAVDLAGNADSEAFALDVTYDITDPTAYFANLKRKEPVTSWPDYRLISRSEPIEVDCEEYSLPRYAEDQPNPITVKCTFVDRAGNTGSATYQLRIVNVIPKLVVSPSTSEITTEGSALLSSSVTDGNAPYVYSWSCTNGQTGNNPTIYFASDTAGTFRCTLTVTDNDGDTVSDTATIRVGEVAGETTAPRNSTDENDDESDDDWVGGVGGETLAEDVSDDEAIDPTIENPEDNVQAAESTLDSATDEGETEDSDKPCFWWWLLGIAALMINLIFVIANSENIEDEKWRLTIPAAIGVIAYLFDSLMHKWWTPTKYCDFMWLISLIIVVIPVGGWFVFRLINQSGQAE